MAKELKIAPMGRVAKAFDTLIKAPVRWLVRTWPFGYLCDFKHERQGRIRLTKSLYVVVGGDKRGDAIDALPITLVSDSMVERIVQEIHKKWYMPALESTSEDAKACQIH